MFNQLMIKFIMLMIHYRRGHFNIEKHNNSSKNLCRFIYCTVYKLLWQQVALLKLLKVQKIHS